MRFTGARKSNRHDIVFRGKRNLVVQLEDDRGDQISLRYIHFYPNQKAQFEIGKYVLASGNIKKV